MVVTFALPSEFGAWRRIARFEPLNGRAGPIYLMRTANLEVYAVMSGIGMRSVPGELEDLLANSADVCIASGLAGSLKKEYSAGTILVAKAVRTSGPDRAIESDKSLSETAKGLGAVPVDFFLTSSAVLNSPAQKSNFGEIADAVDMESFHVLSRAADYGVPCVAVRAVSDGAETNLPFDLNRIIDHRGQIRWSAALNEIVRSPLRVPRLIRFGAESAGAARNLARFLHAYTQSLTAAPRVAHEFVGGAERK
jgi:adenosylhomocysteine nucleosidase